MGLGRRQAERRVQVVSIKSIASSQNPQRIIAIDPSSHSLGWAVIDISKEELVASGKILLTKTQDISVKFDQIFSGITEVCLKHKPSVAIIEQSVYIQNFQTSRIISYIIGYTWGVLSRHCGKVIDINPMLWKRGIGYVNISKHDKERLQNDKSKGSFESKKKKERKDRVNKIVAKHFMVEHINDDDIVDAIGIALWYHLMVGKK